MANAIFIPLRSSFHFHDEKENFEKKNRRMKDITWWKKWPMAITNTREKKRRTSAFQSHRKICHRVLCRSMNEILFYSSISVKIHTTKALHKYSWLFFFLFLLYLDHRIKAAYMRYACMVPLFATLSGNIAKLVIYYCN